MALIVQPGRVLACLNELEREFLRVGAEKCRCLEEPSQLSAFLRLGVRAVSLVRGMLPLLGPNTLDSFDAVRRAFLETWQLQFEFRLTGSSEKTARWFEDQGRSWAPDPQKIADFIESLGRKRPKFGREYGDLSELAHPTAKATANSCAVATTRLGISSVSDQIDKAVNELSEDFTGLLIHEIWLVDAIDPRLIDIHIPEDRIPECEGLYREFLASLSS